MGAPRPPLRNTYWVLPGKVLAGEHPGGTNVDATRDRLKRLMDVGVECFIDLTEPGELKPYDGELPFSVEYLRKPIKDHGTPAQRMHMAEILDCLHDALLSGRCVYVHCRAGIGRTGTVVGCFLVERGLDGEAALDELNRLWQQCERSHSWASIPETDDQIDFVRRWKARAVFNDRGQLAGPTLTVDDEAPMADEGAPWAHLLVDSKSAAGTPGPGKGPVDPTRKAAKGSPSAAPPGAVSPGTPSQGAASPTLRRGTSPSAAPSSSSPSASGAGKPTSPTWPAVPATGVTPAHPAAAAASSPGSASPARRTTATPPRPSPANPSAANFLIDPTSVANLSGGRSTPASAPAPSTGAPFDDNESDPLLNPEALAAVSNLRGRFHGALLGLAVGDAVAAATQYRRPGSFTPVGDMLGGGPFDLPRGGWSDDTAMALCLADSLLEREGFDARDQMDRYRRWQQEGYLSATGQCVGITASSARAIAMAQWRRQAFSGSHDPTQLDPEPLSRVAPVVLYFFATHGQALDQSTEAARATCQAPAVLEACRSLARALHAALEGQPKAVVLERAALAPGALPAGAIPTASLSGGIAQTNASAAAGIQQGSTGASAATVQASGAAPSHAAAPVRGGSTAPAALAAAVAAFGATDNFRDAILYAANLGGDSDVVTAICGQLAGAYYGVRAIPTSWHNGLMRKELITSYADRLLARVMVGMAG